MNNDRSNLRATHILKLLTSGVDTSGRKIVAFGTDKSGLKESNFPLYL